MQNWKKAVIAGSVAAGVIMILKGKRSLGAAAATGGLVLLASEYPEQFEQVWENAPEYISRGAQIFQTVQRLAERYANEAGEGVGNALRAVGDEYLR